MVPDRRCVHHAVRSLTPRLQLRAAALSLVTFSLLLTLPGCSGANGIADEQVVPRTPENVVLVYTDNTPGIRVVAYATHRVLRQLGHATVVTTDEAEFIRRLPTRPWARVLVATRFESTQPAYLKPLRAYMESVERARAEIYTCLDDSDARLHPGELVIAPVAIQTWDHGSTSRGYAGCKEAPQLDTIHGAYVLCDFKGVQSETLSPYPEPIGTLLEPGEYEPLAKTQSASL